MIHEIDFFFYCVSNLRLYLLESRSQCNVCGTGFGRVAIPASPLLSLRADLLCKRKTSLLSSIVLSFVL